MERRARFMLAPLVLASGAGFFACSSSHDSGKSSTGLDKGVEAQRVMAAVQRSKTFAHVVATAKMPHRTDGGWVIGEPSTKAAVVNAHLDARLPLHADGSMHVGRNDSPGEFVDVSAEGLKRIEGHLVDNALVFADAAPSTDVVHVLDGATVEELRVLRDNQAPTVARYDIRKGSGIESVRVRGNRVQALDKDGHVRLQTAGVFAVDAKGVRRDLAVEVSHQGDHDVVTASLDTNGLEFPVIVDPAWATVASMKNPRQYAAAVALTTGKIMVAGGENFAAAVNAVEQYDPATDAWSDLASMTYDRSGGKLIALPGGRALAVGGIQGLQSDGTAAEAPNELFNGTTWVAPATDPDPRANATIEVLDNGKLLVIGGEKQTYTACTTVAFGSPSTCPGDTSGFDCQQFDPGPHTPGQPGYCSGTLKQTYTPTAEVYDGTTNTWTAAGSLAGLPAPAGSTGFGGTPDFPAVSLFTKLTAGPSAGKYLVVYNSAKATTATPSTTSDYVPEKPLAQIFDPATNTWSAALPDLPAAATVKARGQFGFKQLPSNKYLFVAGLGLTGTAPSFTTTQLATSFTLDLSTTPATWGTTGVLRCARDRFATVLDSGKVRVTMGNIKPFVDPVKGNQYCNEEEYNPATDTWTVTQQSTNQGAPWNAGFGGVVTCENGCLLPLFVNGMYVWPQTTGSGTGSILNLVDFNWRTFFPASTPDTTVIGNNAAYAVTSTGKILAAGGNVSGSGMTSDAELWTQMVDGSDCNYVSGGFGGTEDGTPTADCFHGWCVDDDTATTGGCGGGSVRKCSDKPGAICTDAYQCNNSSFGGTTTIGCVKTAPTDATGHCTKGAECTTAASCTSGQACISDGTSSTGKRCSFFCSADAQCPTAKSKCVNDYRGYTGTFCGPQPKACSDDTKALCPSTATVCPDTFGGPQQFCTSGKCTDAPTCTTAADCAAGQACHDYGSGTLSDGAPAMFGKHCAYICFSNTECAAGKVCASVSGGGGGGPADAGASGGGSALSPSAPCVTPTTPDAGPADTGSPTDTGTPATDTGTPATDTGTPATDTGTPATDTGTPATDTGTPATDTGTPATDSGDDTAVATDSGTATDADVDAVTMTDSATPDGVTTEDSDVDSSSDDASTEDSAVDTGAATLDDAGAVTPPVEEESSGCGCEIPGGNDRGSSAALVGVALAGLVIARRRRTR